MNILKNIAYKNLQLNKKRNIVTIIVNKSIKSGH